MIDQRTERLTTITQSSSKEVPSLRKQWDAFINGLNLERNDNQSWIANTPHGRRIVRGVLINTQPAVYYQEEGRTFATPAPWINPRNIQTPPGMYVDPSWKTQE